MSVTLFPQNFEQKTNFTEVRQMLSGYAESNMGKELVEAMKPSDQFELIVKQLRQTNQMQILLSGQRPYRMPYLCSTDCRPSLYSIRPGGTYMEEEALLHIADMLESLEDFKQTLQQSEENSNDENALSDLADIIVDAPYLPQTRMAIRALFNDEQQIKDTATKELYRIRTELRLKEQSISGTMRRITKQAREEGWIDADVNPTLRDGRLVIPLPPEHKRKVRGIVYDESATGKTVFVEPAEIVEANNQIRELEAEERREIIKILIGVADKLRPNLKILLYGVEILALLDFIRAKARLGIAMHAVMPMVKNKPIIKWYKSRHPILERSLTNHGRKIVPLDITLEEPNARILVISGPNAGGKSVCLKTVGLLQLMLQCGLLLPLDTNSQCGIFKNLCIDIGDEQSIEDDLSTYSSHLSNLKQFLKIANRETLILIDEFGSGTEPQIGGAIAQAVLKQVNTSQAFGVLTTHFQNLKTFAEETDGIINGAMLYERHELRPLFRLEIGRPGSSFAIEIARKTGLPESVIQDATDLVGTDYVSMDKFLQDIVRDKRYWESKRTNIRKEEKRLSELTADYANKLQKIEQETKKIIAEAKDEAKKIIQQSGKEIERTIREIKEAEAEKERTKQIRAQLQAYGEELESEDNEAALKEKKYQQELAKIKRREERKKRKKEQIKPNNQQQNTQNTDAENKEKYVFSVGDNVKIEGQKIVGTILELKDDKAMVAIGMIKSFIPLDKLTPTKAQKKDLAQTKKSNLSGAVSIIDQIHDKRLSFKQDIDVRGMRVTDGIQSVAYFIDDAVQLGIARVRILHGTGTGALRKAIREYLSGVPMVKRYADEHVQFGGAGITVVDLE